MSKQKSTLPIVALIVASILWGVNAPLIKLALQTIPVTIFISVKFLASSLLILPFALKTWRPLRRKELGLMILSSIMWMTFSTLLQDSGLRFAPSINFAVIGLLGPLLLWILSVEFLKERASLKALSGVLLAFVGALIVIGKPWEASLHGQSILLGNVLIFAGTLCGVVSAIIAKPILKRMSSFQATFLYIFPGTVPIALLSLSQLSGWHIHDVATGAYIAIIYGLIAVTLANFLFMYGLKFKLASQVGVFQYIEPVATIIAAWFILAERPSARYALGAGFVFVGIYLAEVHTSRRAALARPRGR